MFEVIPHPEFWALYFVVGGAVMSRVFFNMRRLCFGWEVAVTAVFCVFGVFFWPGALPFLLENE